jgi:predicted transcriptional regulator
MLTKEKIIEAIKDMPNKFSVDDLLDRIMLLQKIEIGLDQSQAGKVVSTDEAKQRLQKWLK